METQRFQAIDGLRGVAILMVTVFHLWEVNGRLPFMIGPFDITPFISSACCGVPLFFAVSGFCLFYPAIKHGDYRFDAKNFFFRRFIRIWPTHVVAVFVFLPIWGSWTHYEGWKWQLFSHLSFIHSLFPDTLWSFNGVLWSLGTEIHFYFVFPFMAWAMYKRPAYTLAVCALLGIACHFFGFAAMDPQSSKTGWGNVILCSLPSYSFAFACGMLCAQFYARFKNPPAWIINATWGVALFRLFVLPFINGGSVYTYHYGVLHHIGWLALIYAALTSQGKLTRILTWKPLVYTGVISYSLYVYNGLIHGMPSRFSAMLTRGTVSCWLIMTIVVFAAGTLGYWLTEKPFIALRAKLRNAPASPATPPDDIKQIVRLQAKSSLLPSGDARRPG